MIPLAAMAIPWRQIIFVAVVLGLCGFAAWQGYEAGYERADAKRLAELREAEAMHAEARTRQAQALAQAEAEARTRLAAAVARGNDLARSYLSVKRKLDAARRKITTRRIVHVSKNVAPDPVGLCRFPADWVRLYNEALGTAAPGAGDGGNALPAAASGPAGNAGAGPAPDPGVSAQNGTAAVTPGDILAHARDYGGRCRTMEAQLRALIEWARGRTR